MNEQLAQILADLREINEMNRRTHEILTNVKNKMIDQIYESEASRIAAEQGRKAGKSV